MSIDLVLHEPEQPGNTGAIGRTCLCAGSGLHLIRPLGFSTDEKSVRRAGLDYWHLVDISVYENIADYFEKNGDDNIFLATTKAPRDYSSADLSGNISILFGKETAGLPLSLREKYRARCIRIPMIDDARSLNLSNSVAILCYEALRQQGFPGLKGFGEMAGS